MVAGKSAHTHGDIRDCCENCGNDPDRERRFLIFIYTSVPGIGYNIKNVGKYNVIKVKMSAA